MSEPVHGSVTTLPHLPHTPGPPGHQGQYLASGVTTGSYLFSDSNYERPCMYLCEHCTWRAPPPGPGSVETLGARASPPGGATPGPGSSPQAPAAPPIHHRPATI